MRAERRAGVAAYVETFILIGLAVGGTALAFESVSRYALTGAGQAVQLGDGQIVQGRFAALEEVAVYNVGASQVSSFVLSSEGAPAGAEYCYQLFDPQTLGPVSSTCPTLNTDPATLSVPSAIRPGGGVLVEVTIIGQPYHVGSSVTMAVTTAEGAQAIETVQVAPA